MMTTYFKIAWRNMTKNKLYSLIKIGGFAISISICILIGLYIKHERSYNTFYSDMNSVYRLVVQIPNSDIPGRWLSLPAPTGPTLKDELPFVEAAGRILPNPLFGAGSNQLTLNNDPKTYYDDGFVYMDQSILDMFPLPMVAGQLAHALDRPNSMVLTKSKAQKYFIGDPIGQTVYLNADTNRAYTVTGVIDDIPTNSHLYGYSFFMSLAGEPFYPGEQTNWVSNNYSVYVKLRRDTDVRQAEQIITKSFYEEHYIPAFLKTGRQLNPVVRQAKISLQNALDIHLLSADIEEDKVATLNRGDIRMVWIFGGTALFILLIACVNFINLSTANAATRAKEVGIRKTVGSDRHTLVIQFITEAIFYSVLSVLLGILICWLLLPLFNNLAGKTLVLPWLTWYFVPSLLLTSVLIGMISGIYPAFYLSRFKPIGAIKHNIYSTSSSLLRNGLVVFQFATSIILIIGALVTNQQVHDILNKDLGFNKEQVVVLNGLQTVNDKLPSLKDELASIPTLKSISVGDFLPVPMDGAKRNGNPFWLEGRRSEDLAKQGQFWAIDSGYISTFGLKLVEGRNFDPTMASDSSAAIVNKRMVAELQLKNPIGAQISNGETWTIIGVVDDFIFDMLSNDDPAPLCMVLRDSPSLLSIKVQSENMDKTLAAITHVWNRFAPNQKINYRFLDESFAELYADVERTKNIISCFALLAILIASLGLFGLVTYIIEQRTKEIGIRKVLGASSMGIIRLLSTGFLRLVILSICIACPIAWWSMHHWFGNLHDRTSIDWWIFIVAGCCTTVLALVTVSFQAYKAARANPIDSLRNE
ncbi:ABC transporter permease [Sphingobacterium suaedae]|uniref:ABC transporter permease n=1 Tax=Sphingobacterium suaedae TaxID=1686402 RepID=A0ABW5KGW6_9SPHI